MDFYQKIFVNDNTLIITTSREQYVKQHPKATGYAFFEGAEKKNFRQAIALLSGSENSAIIEDKSEDNLWKEFHALYRPIDAAGGVVFNEKGELLMIFRRGKWDLPKGKLDKNEDIETCALREVSEETGLKRLTIEGKVCDTYHIYKQGGEQLVKRTAWYKMTGTARDKLMPQIEEEIMEAKWAGNKELAALAAQSYEAVREVMHKTGLKF